MSSPFPLDDAALAALFTDAHSTIKFAQQPVDPAVLEQVVTLTQLGPTWMNSQPLRIVRISNESRDAAIATMWGGNQPKAAAAPEILLLAADTDFHDYLVEQAGAAAAAAQQSYAADQALRTDIALQSANMQAGYFIMALRAAGLGVRPIGGL